MATVFVIQELVDTIMHFLHEDNITLRSASSVNKTFHAACFRHIFHSITLPFGPANSQLEDRIPHFHNLLNTAPRIAKYVRRVCFRGNFDTLHALYQTHDTHLSEILDGLKLITSIEICHYQDDSRFSNLGRWEGVPVAIKDSLPLILLSPRLRELTLRNLKHIPFTSLRLSVNLSRLRLVHTMFLETSDNGVAIPTRDAIINIPPSERPRLDFLTLHEHRFTTFTNTYFHGPYSLFDLSNLKTLNIPLADGCWSGWDGPWKYIYPLKTHIEHLGLLCNSWRVNCDRLDLGQLISLRSLHLVWSMNDGYDATWMHSLLRTLTVPNRIEEVVLLIIFRSSELVRMSAGGGRVKWDTLDDVVHDAAFPVLRAFDVNIYAPNLPHDELKAHINSNMVHLRHRGILNVRSITAIPVDFRCR